MFSSIPKGSGLRYSTHSVSDFLSLPRLCKRLTSRLVSCPAGGRLVTREALRLLTLRPKSSRLEGCRWCLRALSMPFSDEASVSMEEESTPRDRYRQQLMVASFLFVVGSINRDKPRPCAGCIAPVVGWRKTILVAPILCADQSVCGFRPNHKTVELSSSGLGLLF